MSNAKEITEERGKNYGHPRDHFACTQAMFRKWSKRRLSALPAGEASEQDDALHHAVYMILDKLARAANNPMHKDNWDDIQGYARTAKMVLEMEE